LSPSGAMGSRDCGLSECLTHLPGACNKISRGGLFCRPPGKAAVFSAHLAAFFWAPLSRH
ncbi:hypothetical protein, partial [Oceanibaculum pacificum]|uniref:hypothetical protein n=1 Tax=Oceanibaculum pacificum TaxID=580166 RepID=UPI001E64C3E8